MLVAVTAIRNVECGGSGINLPDEDTGKGGPGRCSISVSVPGFLDQCFLGAFLQRCMLKLSSLAYIGQTSSSVGTLTRRTMKDRGSPKRG
jgi:hypothetical protein